jgi:hypothetical protein
MTRHPGVPRLHPGSRFARPDGLAAGPGKKPGRPGPDGGPDACATACDELSSCPSAGDNSRIEPCSSDGGPLRPTEGALALPSMRVEPDGRMMEESNASGRRASPSPGGGPAPADVINKGNTEETSGHDPQVFEAGWNPPSSISCSGTGESMKTWRHRRAGLQVPREGKNRGQVTVSMSLRPKAIRPSSGAPDRKEETWPTGFFKKRPEAPNDQR